MFYMRSWCREKNRKSHDEFVRCDVFSEWLLFFNLHQTKPQILWISCVSSRRAHAYIGVCNLIRSPRLGLHEQKTSTLKMNLWTSLARNQEENNFTLKSHVKSLCTYYVFNVWREIHVNHFWQWNSSSVISNRNRKPSASVAIPIVRLLMVLFFGWNVNAIFFLLQITNSIYPLLFITFTYKWILFSVEFNE